MGDEKSSQYGESRKEHFIALYSPLTGKRASFFVDAYIRNVCSCLGVIR